MAPKITGAENPTIDAATGHTGTATQGTESGTQDNNANALTELQAQLTETQSKIDSFEKAKNDAMAKALQYEAMYKGLQNQTTRTLQKAAEDRKALEQARSRDAELAEIREALSTVTAHLLDDGDRKELELRQREIRLKLAEQAAKDAGQAAQYEAQIAQTAASPQVSPEQQKAEFVNYYFPNEGIDPNDSRIDWANENGLDPREAFRRFTTSIVKIKNEKVESSTQDLVTQLKKQNEEMLKAQEQRIQELVTQSNVALEQAKKDATESARKDSETRLRKLGADVTSNPVPDGARRTLAQQVTEELDDRLLTQGKKGQDEYRRRLDAIGKQVREGY